MGYAGSPIKSVGIGSCPGKRVVKVIESKFSQILLIAELENTFASWTDPGYLYSTTINLSSLSQAA